ncbi:NADPH:quinone oxidoreductase family protein [Alphaproteobacteria bacterium]|nr:NADPH:quinone oxidoreductase family protein [Alphaproteobacteria bacterium]
MKALICNELGDINNLEFGEINIPDVGPNQILIKVKTSSANYADIVMINGQYQTKPDIPFAPGLECAGVVESVGSKISRFKPGDKVLAKLKYGGFAEYAIANEDSSFIIPNSMSWEEAGAFFVAYISSYVAIKWQGSLKSNETILILGASGGTGITAIEISKSMGANVIAAASTKDKLSLCKQYGADYLINYKDENLKEKIYELTSGKGVNAVFDPVGGNLFDSSLSSLGWGGRYIIFGFVAGIPKIPANRLLVKHRTAVGSSLRYYEMFEPEKIVSSVNQLFEMFNQGKIKPLVSKVYTLEKGAEALNDLKNRKSTGRIIIKVN